ncbi:NADP-dependent oxidoreductase [candidate division KSB1 bacterium]
MKTLQVTEFGAPTVLKCFDIPVPIPKDDEVLIKISAAGVNPVDAKTRRGIGFVAELIKDRMPWTLGYELSGVIEETGQGVNGFKKGDAVFGMVGLPKRSSCYAEYTTALPEELWFKPKNLSHTEAAGVPLAALTAWQGLFNVGNISKGDRILIHAAAGGVGHFAVQFAKSTGAYVICTASKHNESYLKDELKADEVIDYSSVKFEDYVSDIDLVFDGVGGEVGIRSVKLLNENGLIIPLATVSAQVVIDEAKKQKKNAKGMLVKADRGHLKEITRLIETGKVKVNIDQVYSLEDGYLSHAKIEEGHVRGKIVLLVGNR